MKRNVFHRYLSAKVLPIWTILLIDVFIIVISTLLAFVLRYDFKSVFLEYQSLDKTILWIVIVNLLSFRIFRTYSNVLRFSSFVDIMRIFVALTMAYAVLIIVSCLSSSFHPLGLAPTSVLLMSYIISFAMMACSRVVVKTFFELLNFDGSHCDNVFIYGAKEAGVNIAKALRVNLRNHYRLRGFIADEPELVGKVMMGVRVYPNDETLISNLVEKNIQTVIVSPAKMEELKTSDIADRLLANNIKLMTAPPLSEWNGQSLNRTQLKEIQIEDLLPRAPIEIDMRKVASHLEGKRVMITGAAGSIGSEIMRQVASFNPYQLILVDQAETPLHDIRLELQDRWRDINAETIIANISNASRMEYIFQKYRPQYIFHAAAYKHVPMMEDNVSESIQVNVYGTRTIADLAVKYGADKFVMISTDKAVNPTNVMGCSKRICEIYVQSLAKKLQKQLEAGSMGNGGEIYIFDMGKPVKIVDLARRMISLSGRTDVKIEFTGLRHGEKLYEELLNVKELTKPTYHEKIMIATVREYDYDEVKERIQKLIDTSYTYDQMKIVAQMKDIVPEFISKNSCFEVLDKKAE